MASEMYHLFMVQELKQLALEVNNGQVTDEECAARLADLGVTEEDLEAYL